jgi:hypothetical protein
MPYGGVRKPGYLYQCAAYAKSRGCPGTFVARGRVERAVLGWLAQYAAAPGAQSRALRGRARARAGTQADRARLAAAAAREEAALTQLTVQLARGVIPADAYAGARDEITARRDEIGAALERLPSPAARDDPPSRESALSLVRDWDLAPVRLRQLALRQFIDRVEVVSHGRQRATLTVTSAWGAEYVLSL